jgi:hypothetical protein
MSTSNCKWDTTVCTDISYCCPKPIACNNGTCDDCCKCCDLQYIKNGVIECEKPNIYNTPYYFQNLTNPYYPSNKNNCCHGEFNFHTNKQGQQIFVTKNSRGGGLGDISYPRNQSGRWNQSNTNTKLFPVISVGRRNPVLKACWKNGSCPPRTTSKYQNIQFPLTTVRQSGRLFKNAHPNQSKRQLFSYLARNRAYLKR